LAISAEININTIYFCPEILPLADLRELLKGNFDKYEIVEVTKAVYSRIAYRESTGGIVAIAVRPEKKLEDLKVTENSIFIILDAIEKPGNLGAICRLADAAAVSGVIVTNLHTDIYNANAIRSSLGCVFTIDLVCAEFEDTLKWLKNNEIKSFSAELKNSNFYYDADFRGKMALVFGTESTGLPVKWIKNSDYTIKIPMKGTIDSLNVNTSVAIILFEAIRQRGLYRSDITRFP
jgi:TrmH family RNA methyltransferase